MKIKFKSYRLIDLTMGALGGFIGSVIIWYLTATDAELAMVGWYIMSIFE